MVGIFLIILLIGKNIVDSLAPPPVLEYMLVPTNISLRLLGGLKVLSPSLSPWIRGCARRA